MMEWLDTVVQGVLLGGLYALFAIGLSITYGVMRLVNIAHGGNQSSPVGAESLESARCPG